MRVAINSRLLIPDRLDGIGWFIYETSRRLVAAHPDVEFHFIFDRKPPESCITGPNVFNHYLLPPARRPILFRMWFNWSLPRLLRRIGADVFLSPDGLGCARCPCPQLVVIHDINFERYPNDLPEAYSDYLQETTRELIESGAHIATVSKFSRREISEVYGIAETKINVIPNAASAAYKPLPEGDRKRVRSENSEGNPFFLFVSSIHPRKNLPRLLLAFDKFVIESGSTHRLVVVGSVFWMFEHVREVLRSMAHQDRVLFVGHVPRETLTQLMAAAEALCFVSYYEGFGIPVLEAFQSGTPVITSAGTAMEEVAGDAALLVDPFDVESIARGMSAVVKDSELSTSLQSKGMQRSYDFSWERSSELLWECIEKSRG